ncbi:transglycosylase domain-containing protein [Virgibacillus kekensis]|uniref:Transglycosylase domain-containing protein n=1 Tax=Virgibacillus kekensis TaxID=202261 RepID=A0ABV9DH09_9BACI
MKKLFKLPPNNNSKKAKWRQFMLWLPVIGLASGVLFLTGVYLVSYFLGPPDLTSDQNTIYYSRDGEVIGEERGSESRYWMELEDISPEVIEATLAIEDQYFYNHNGFDLKRIAGAVMSDLTTLSLKEGASTLTQQYARNLYLTFEKTWTRKIKEAFYTVRLEMFYSKDEILEGYLNTIYYGHGAYGIEAASRYFFDKSASELTLAESSMLAAIPKGPSYYSPLNDLENAETRQKRILALMKENGDISNPEYYLAVREHLNYVAKKEEKRTAVAPYFQDTVLQEAVSILEMNAERVRSGGYEIYTTLDTERQQELENQANSVIDSGSEIQIGAMALNPETGEIRALVGGRDYEESQFNRAVQAKRMAGSTFKPFLYYAALIHGYDPTTMLMSKPTSFELENGEVYQPSNYNGYYAYEPISLAQALALSDNVYAVRTNLYLGPETLVKTAKKFGIDGHLPSVPSLALGTASVTVEDMVTGYGMIANGGYEIDSHTITRIVDRNGKEVYTRESEQGERVLDPQSTFILTQLMTGIFDSTLNGYMSVTGSTVADELSRTYAAKSGTTNTDSWMIGFSPDLVTGIWTGYDNSKEIVRTAEEAYAKDIWAGFMEAAHQDKPLKRFDMPAGVVGVPIDPESGERASTYCETSRVMYFEKGTEPTEYCSVHLPGGEEPEKEKKKDKKGLFQRLFEMLF